MHTRYDIMCELCSVNDVTCLVGDIIISVLIATCNKAGTYVMIAEQVVFTNYTENIYYLRKIRRIVWMFITLFNSDNYPNLSN